MAKAQADKRTRLIETATNLAHLRGIRETSLADIAEAANVPVGNVYYYFKTKDELGEAIVERRLAEFRAFRDELNRLGSPKERVLELRQMRCVFPVRSGLAPRRVSQRAPQSHDIEQFPELRAKFMLEQVGAPQRVQG